MYGSRHATLNEGGSDGESDDENEASEGAALLKSRTERGATLWMKIPKAVFFIIGNEFCERFSYYGMRTVLSLYLHQVLHYTDNTATIIYHVFTMLCYFFPLFGAILADSFLGKFRTIFYLSIVYCLGNVVLSVASAGEAMNIPGREVTIIGLLLIAVGTGGIKPCVAAFGGDQFKLPEQEKQLALFFSAFYFSINFGSLLSTFLTPVLRKDVECLGVSSCYPLAFGVPAALMIVSLIVFLIGKPLYAIKKPQGNVLLNVCKLICHAVKRKRAMKDEKRDHWLDYSEDKYSKQEIGDVKAVLHVLCLLIPLPVFWALFDQQGSRWTFQATYMDGQMGGYTLKPDQMQFLNPLLILAFIPIFDVGIYPLLLKCNILKTPLQRLTTGGILAAVAFIVSTFVELSLEPTYAVLPKSSEAQLRIFNGFDCEVNLTLSGANQTGQHLLSGLQKWEDLHISVEGESEFKLRVSPLSSCPTQAQLETKVKVYDNEATSYFLTFNKQNDILLSGPYRKDKIEKPEESSYVRILYSFQENATHTFKLKIGDTVIASKILEGQYGNKVLDEVKPENLDVFVDETKIISPVKIGQSGVYTLLIQEDQNGGYVGNLITVTPPNSVHMLWLIPQYVIITMGEVMFSITGLQFCFTQAPPSMKSVIQAAWLMTVAFGNLIVVIVAEAHIFERQAYEFVLFAALMIIDMVIFALIAMKYHYVEFASEDLPLQEAKEKQNN